MDSNTENFLRQIDMDGFCIVEDVIPEHQIEHIRDEIMHAEREQHDRTEADRNRTRSRGHRVSAKGVSALRHAFHAQTVLSTNPVMIAPTGMQIGPTTGLMHLTFPPLILIPLCICPQYGCCRISVKKMVVHW